MDMGFVAAMTAQFYVTSMGLPLEIVMGVTGLFHKERNIAILTTSVNLVISLALVGRLGVVGITIGTIAAYLVQIGCRMGVFFREYAKRSVLPYLADLAQYGAVTLAEAVILYRLAGRVYRSGLAGFLLTALLVAFLALGCSLLPYCRSWKWKSLLETAGRLLRGRSR